MNAKFIYSKDWRGKEMILVDSRTKLPVPVGKAFMLPNKCDRVTVIGGTAPHKSSSSGLVQVRFENRAEAEYFPSVANAEWEEMQNEDPAPKLPKI
jgi:hypothetical protein